MHTEYADITSRLGEPLWWDDVCAPRYEPFQPYLCNDIYADEAMLIEIRCQHCGKAFLVADTWNPFDGISGHLRLSEFAEHNRAEWGDPPAHGCVGDTMTSESVRIAEFWKRSPVPFSGWERKTEYEKPMPPWWLEEDCDG